MFVGHLNDQVIKMTLIYCILLYVTYRDVTLENSNTYITINVTKVLSPFEQVAFTLALSFLICKKIAGLSIL